MKLDEIALAGSALFTAAMILAATTAKAEPAPRNCGPHAQVVERLAEGYGESPVGLGLASNGTAVQVFANLDTGTWTITTTVPQGITCLVASGQSWTEIATLPAGDPA